MVLYHIYSREHRIRYFANPCSTATLFQFTCLLLTFLPPLFTGYFTGGFYYKELSYSEQPQVVFTDDYYIVVDSPSGVTFSSSDSRLNRFYQTSYASSYLRAILPQDTNGDGLPDILNITIELQTLSLISGRTIDLWLPFQYALNQFPLINMTALGYLSLKVPPALSGPSTVIVYGQLLFQQNQPILSYENDSSLQNTIINYGSFVVTPAFDEIWSNYTQRNYYTTFEQQYVQWSSVPSGTATTVTITVIVNIGQQVIRYVPSFWREFRWSWIQYLAGLIPFMYVFNKVKEFVFSTGLVRTVITKSL